MKRFQMLLCLLLSLMLLTACAAPAMDATQPTTTAAATEATTEATEPQWQPYTGQSSRGYVYYYQEEGRERDWEEDILYLADSYTWEYGQLSQFAFRIEYPDDVEYSEEFYDPELRQTFLDEINGLIPQIPELTDDEILYELQRIVCLLNDAHICIYLPESELFPIGFHVFYEEEQPAVRAILLPEAYVDWLYAELVAINGYDMAQVEAMMAPYNSHENRYWLYELLYNAAYNGTAITLMDLQAAGIVAKDSDDAVYTLQNEAGETVDVALSALTYSQYGKQDLVYHMPTEAYSTEHANSDSYYWHTLLERDTVYIRINQFEEDPEYTFLTLGNEVLAGDRERGGTKNVIVDIRDNPGGYAFLGYNELITVLQRMDVENIYVLINSNTFSNGIIMASSIRREIPEAILVGTPGGQPANFFAGMSDGDFVMPNCDVIFRMPTCWNAPLPDFEGDALLPDVTVWPTIEDYQQNRDTVLEAVLNMS